MSTATAPAPALRAASEADADVIAAIHNEGIAERQATFEMAECSPADAVGWIGSDREPLLVAELDGRVAGFARVMRSSDRCATTTNAASVALAARAGFRQVGVHERHGCLDGKWKDLLLVERPLGDAASTED